MRIVAIFVVTIVFLGAGLWAARVRHERQVGALWRSLTLESGPEVFTLDQVEGLPDLAQRYLRHAIAVGTPLARSVVLGLTGTIRLQPEGDPLPMDSEEILTPPLGFVWRARVGRGFMGVEGFDRYGDGVGEMRWWLAGLVPVASASGPDVSRSAWGRMLGESVLIPATLLPARGALWTAVNDSTAIVRLGGETDAVDVTLEIEADGRLRSVHFERWNSDPSNGPIGMTGFRMETTRGDVTFDGYTIPGGFKAGWSSAGSDPSNDYAFFEARIESASYR